jgi:hypothetical protein
VARRDGWAGLKTAARMGILLGLLQEPLNYVDQRDPGTLPGLRNKSQSARAMRNHA